MFLRQKGLISEVFGAVVFKFGTDLNESRFRLPKVLQCLDHFFFFVWNLWEEFG